MAHTAAALLLFAGGLALLLRRMRKGKTFTSNVTVALAGGLLFGVALQGFGGEGAAPFAIALEWIGLVGGGYVRLLQMIVVPLVLVSILSAVAGMEGDRPLGRVGGGILGVLLLTTALSAVVGVGVTLLFDLSAESIVAGSREVERGVALEGRAAEVGSHSIPDLLLALIPTNPFADLTGARPTSILGVVIFATFLGIAVRGVAGENPELGRKVREAIEGAQRVVLRLVRIVLRLTPIGIFALILRLSATVGAEALSALLRFLAASYVGLAAILLLHALLLAAAGIRPGAHFRAIRPVLAFAFASRSSAAAIPLNSSTQIESLGVAPGIAHFAASMGATIGQNGCAGLYPAMLAVMIAPTVGIDPTAPGFLLSLILVVTLGSFGVAGVGGGATFAAILVLSALDLPVALAGLLISIEPVIDMGRTVVNVSGSITAGTVTNALLHPPRENPDPAPG